MAADDDPSPVRDATRALLYPNGLAPAPIDLSGIKSYGTTGEFLAVDRAAQFEDGDTTYLDSHAGLADPRNLHSMALQVDLLWADLNIADDAWQDGASAIWKAYFDPSVAAAITDAGLRAGDGGDPVTALNEAIAYSAVNEGEMPFGNAALPAMFDDAADIGRGSLPSAVRADLGKVAVEYARLAFNDVTLDPAGPADAPEYKSALVVAQNGSTVSADFSTGKWTFGSGGAEPSAFKDMLITDAATSAGAAADLALALNAYAADHRLTLANLFAPITSVSFELSAAESIDIPSNIAGMNLLFLQPGSGADASGSGADRVIVGAAASDTIKGGDQGDLLVGGDGDDDSSGGSGRNYLFGGSGNDHLLSSGTNDVLCGGTGNDYLQCGSASAKVLFSRGDGHDVVETASFGGDYTLKLEGLTRSDISFVVGGHTGNPDYYWWQGYLQPQFLAIRINDTGDTITFRNEDVPITTANRPDPGYALHADYAEKYSPLSAIEFGDGTTWSKSDMWPWLYQWANPNVTYDLVFGEQHEPQGSGMELRTPDDYIDHINGAFFQARPQVFDHVL